MSKRFVSHKFVFVGALCVIIFFRKYAKRSNRLLTVSQNWHNCNKLSLLLAISFIVVTSIPNIFEHG